jgi:hypothetical protein
MHPMSIGTPVSSAGSQPGDLPAAGLLTALRRLEWSASGPEAAQRCPACGGSPASGHTTDCYLAAALNAGADHVAMHHEALQQIERAASAAIGDCDANDGMVTAADARRILLNWMQRIRSTALGAINTRAWEFPG